MDQITSALIGIGLVLSAVFGPMAFFGGSTGVIYRQFSVTIIASMLLSVVVALILTPVLCATLLKPVPKGHEPAENGGGLVPAAVLPLVRPRLFRARTDMSGWSAGPLARKCATWSSSC
jgi:multidrug efflux pump subunit AcrB